MECERECPAGHNLVRWRNRPQSQLRCDGLCGEKLHEGAWRWSCALCDFDVCETCVDKIVTTRSETPLCPPAQARVTAPASAANSAPSRPPAGRKQQDANFTGAAATAQGTPAVGTAAQSLDSVKRDLDNAFPGSGSSALPLRPHSKSVRLPASEQGELGLRIAGASASLSQTLGGPAAEAVAQLPRLELEADGSAPSFFAALPALTSLGLPTAVLGSMIGRREWMQELLASEIARAKSAARGEVSTLEAACGVAPPEQQQSESAACAAVLRKFEHERGQIVAAELHEIDALRVSGKVGLMKPPTAA